ncbi:MAG: hypothetical protein GY845_11365 [Planctomycetes bacterium]|nr:hypothetical protein [Planctomycetota bacterium]
MAIEKNIVIGADLSGLEQKLDELIDALKASQTQADKTADSINEIADTTKDIGKSAEDSQKGIKGLGTGFKGLGVAIKAAGIGLLLAAMDILKELFDNNQKTVDFFNTTFNTLQVAFSDFSKFISANIGGIADFFQTIFENPVDSIKALGEGIKNNIIERFQSMLEVLGFVGEAMKKFFTGDFKGALDSVKAAGTEMVDVLTGVDDSAKKIAEGTTKAAKAISNYVVETVKQGAAMTETNKQAEIAEVRMQGLIEKYDLQAEKLRQVRDDERFTIEERIKANNDLKEVLEEQENAMLENAQRILDAKARQLSLDKDNIEFQKEYIAAQNELVGVQAQVAGFRSEQLMNEMALQRELLDLEMSRKENALEVSDIYRETLLEVETNLFKQLKLEEKFNRERYEQELQLLTEKKSLYKEGTQAYADAEAEIYLLMANRTAQERLEGKKRRELEQQVQQSKIQMTGDAIGALNDLAQAFLSGNEEQAKKAFQINKALGISQAVVNTAQAVTAALTAGGNPAKLATGAQFVEAGIAAATGAAQIATIARQQFQASGSVDTNIQTPTAPSTSPQFNIVGASGQNAILESLQANPMRAYVVGSDVTSQQELDRNRINQVSFP